MQVTKRRARRKDRKVDVKPSLPISMRKSIFRLSTITQLPVKSVAEHLLIEALRNNEILNQLSNYFLRDIRINNTLYRGNMQNPSIKVRHTPGTHERITMRVNLKTNEVLTALTYALDCSKARVCAVLLEYSLKNVTILNNFLSGYIEREFDKSTMIEFKKMLKEINKDVPEGDFSLADLISSLTEQLNAPLALSKEKVDEVIVNFWFDNN